MQTKAINTGFNALVETMSRGMLTWEPVDTDYSSYEEMRQDYLATGVLKVNTDHSDYTIFGDPRTNWAFRAWHDTCHLLADADFSLEGEKKAADLQIKQMWAFMGKGSAVAPLFERLIHAEVVGQAEYFFETGKYPENQYDWAVEYLRKTEKV